MHKSTLGDYEYEKVLHLENNIIKNISVADPNNIPPGTVVVDDAMRGWINRGSAYDPVAHACIPPFKSMPPYYVWDPEQYQFVIDQEMYDIVDEQWRLGNKCNGPCE